MVVKLCCLHTLEPYLLPFLKQELLRELLQELLSELVFHKWMSDFLSVGGQDGGVFGDAGKTLNFWPL